MTGRLRGLGRWIGDWRTGATIVASILVALLALVVIDSIQSRRASDARADRTVAELQITVQELQRRGVRIDDLAAQLDAAATSRDRLAEEVRALRELLIDAGMLEPRPAVTARETPRTGPGTSPRASSRPSQRPSPQTAPKPKPSPKPSPSPSPTPCTVRNPITGECIVPARRR